MHAASWIGALAAIAAFMSLPAEAAHRHRVVHTHPYVSFGFGYPFGFGHYRPYYSPWYGPTFGVGVHVGDRQRVRRARAERAPQREQRALKLYVYPAAGQSEAQTADDRYQCHVWAADASGHDPTLGAGSRDDAESYTRAFTACMEGRNYVVK